MPASSPAYLEHSIGQELRSLNPGRVPPAPAPEPREPGEGGAAVEVSGRVVAVGSEPHVLLVVVTEAGGEYELVGELAAELWGLQQRRVRVRGHVVQPAYGPGFPAQLQVDEYTLPGTGEVESAGG